jgi:NitT/TauT family transport system permease protein/taurine transport system permease protein
VPHRILPLLFVVPFLIIIAAWVLAKSAFGVSGAALPSIGDVIHASHQLIDWGILPYDVAASLYRIALGTALAIVIGVPLGLLLGPAVTASSCSGRSSASSGLSPGSRSSRS